MAQVLPSTPSVQANFTPYLIRVNPDQTNCKELARHLLRTCPVRRPRLVIDCQDLQCVRRYGVSYFVSQLLTLHGAGAQVLLQNVPPTLQRCLHLLGLDQVFHLSPAGAA
jgi:anti-anti-sigma regulatory factor